MNKPVQRDAWRDRGGHVWPADLQLQRRVPFKVVSSWFLSTTAAASATFSHSVKASSSSCQAGGMKGKGSLIAVRDWCFLCISLVVLSQVTSCFFPVLSGHKPT